MYEDEDKKDELEEEKDSNELTEDDKPLEEMSEEELESLMEDLKKDSNGKVKKINIGLGKKIFDNIFLELLYEYVVFLILAFSVNVLTKAITTPLYIFCIYILIYTVFYYFIKMLFYKKWSMVMILSFGSIGLLISILGFFVSGELLILTSRYLIKEFTFTYNSIGMVILCLVLFTILKVFVINYIYSLKLRIGRKKHV